jgi:hypothetical protein
VDLLYKRAFDTIHAVSLYCLGSGGRDRPAAMQHSIAYDQNISSHIILFITYNSQVLLRLIF